MDVVVRLSRYLWRPMTASGEDTDFVLAMRNSGAAREVFFTSQITRDDHLRFLRLAAERGEINWIIEADGQRMGASGIYRIDRQNRRAEGGRVVTKVPELHLLNSVVTAYVAFEHLGLNKVVGEALASNLASNRAGERLGFVLEGRLREHVFKDGSPRDVYVYGILASEWCRLKAGLFTQFGEPQLIRHATEAAG